MNAIQLFKLDQEVRLGAMRAATQRYEGLDQDAKELVSELLNAGQNGVELTPTKDSMFEIYGITKMLTQMGYDVSQRHCGPRTDPGPFRAFVLINRRFVDDMLAYQQMLDLGLRTEDPLWT